MGKTMYNFFVLVAVLVILWFIMIAKPVVAYGKEPEVVEIVAIYDELGGRGTATITHVRATFSIEVTLPDGEVVRVENWRTAKYDMEDVKAVSDKIFCVGQYIPPKYAKYRITRKIFLKAGLD